MLFVTESDGEERIKTIAEIHEELSEVDLPLPDVENDDMTESEDNEEESEDKSNHDGAHGRPSFFRARTENRIVKDIHCALDESNYDLLVILSESGSNRATKEKKHNLKIFWTNQKPNFFGKPCWENIASNRRGVKPEYRNYDTTDEAWSLFFDDDIIKHIFICTNQRICEKAATISHKIFETNSCFQVK